MKFPELIKLGLRGGIGGDGVDARENEKEWRTWFSHSVRQKLIVNAERPLGVDNLYHLTPI